MNKTTYFLRTKDLQEVLHVGRNRAYDLMRSDGFPSFKIGGNYFVKLDDVLKWADDYKYGVFVQ